MMAWGMFCIVQLISDAYLIDGWMGNLQWELQFIDDFC